MWGLGLCASQHLCSFCGTFGGVLFPRDNTSTGPPHLLGAAHAIQQNTQGEPNTAWITSLLWSKHLGVNLLQSSRQRKIRRAQQFLHHWRLLRVDRWYWSLLPRLTPHCVFVCCHIGCVTRLTYTIICKREPSSHFVCQKHFFWGFADKTKGRRKKEKEEKRKEKMNNISLQGHVNRLSFALGGVTWAFQRNDKRVICTLQRNKNRLTCALQRNGDRLTCAL